MSGVNGEATPIPLALTGAKPAPRPRASTRTRGMRRHVEQIVRREYAGGALFAERDVLPAVRLRWPSATASAVRVRLAALAREGTLTREGACFRLATAPAAAGDPGAVIDAALEALAQVERLLREHRADFALLAQLRRRG